MALRGTQFPSYHSLYLPSLPSITNTRKVHELSLNIQLCSYCIYSTILYLFYPIVSILPYCIYSTLLYLFYPIVSILPYCIYSTLLYLFYPIVSILPYCIYSTLLYLFYPIVSILPYCIFSPSSPAYLSKGIGTYTKFMTCSYCCLQVI